jgi:hypothetical protein
MSLKPIKLSELIEALEFDSDERVTNVDLQNGCVMSVDRSLLSAVEENDEASLGDLPDWQKPELEIARAIVDDSGERFVVAPDKFDFHEYRQIERFIGTVDDAGAAEQLLLVIKGKGAFRYFKDTASRLGLLKQWYQFRDEALKEFVVAWTEARQIPFMDDVKKPTQP